MLLVVGGMLSGMLIGCRLPDPAKLAPICVEDYESGWRVGGIAWYITPSSCCQMPGTFIAPWNWPLQNQIDTTDTALARALYDKFGGWMGFGSKGVALAELGISVQEPMFLLHVPHINDPTLPEDVRVPAATLRPLLFIYDDFLFDGDADRQAANLTHELAHYWDQAQGYRFTAELTAWVQAHPGEGTAATNYGATGGPSEDFAEAVTVYFWPQYENPDPKTAWTDNAGRGKRLREAGMLPPPGLVPFPWLFDRHDYLRTLFFGQPWGQ